MNVLNRFLKETKREIESPAESLAASPSLPSTSISPSVIVSDKSAVSADSAASVSRYLLIAGCNDWENATTKSPIGLDGPHLIKLDAHVSATYSSSSSLHLFIVDTSGSLYCCGRNESGQLGLGDTETRVHPTKVPASAVVSFSSPIVKIACGKSHSLALLQNGQLWGCGSNEFGQLGHKVGEKKKSSASSQQFTNWVQILFPSSLSTSSAVHITDVSAGERHSVCCDSQGRAWVFGHPEYGQLGLGTTGEFLKDGGRGPALQYNVVRQPTLVETFVCKDTKGAVTTRIAGEDIFIRKVSAGKNHTVFLEDWEGRSAAAEESSADSLSVSNRVFSCGFGGYGRLGHNGCEDELLPREISFFSTPPHQKINPQRLIREINCGSTCTLAVSLNKFIYFFGKLSNSPRGEATMYPKPVLELCDYKVECCSAGSNFVFVSAKTNPPPSGPLTAPTSTVCVGWGVCVAGRFGLDGNMRSSTNPQFVTAVDSVDVVDVSCGYGHVCYVVTKKSPEGRDVEELFPVLLDLTASSTTTGKRAAGGAAAADKKKGRK